MAGIRESATRRLEALGELLKGAGDGSGRGVVRALARRLIGARPPTYQGEVDVNGCLGPVRIRRDGCAVPYIDAERELDAWFGLGFCHAQDRAAQLEIVLRGVRGTLAEAIGPDGLAIDRLSRRIGFRRAGERQLAAAPEGVREQLAAYVRGLNQGLERGGPRAPELVLLRREPTPWEPADVQGYSALLCFMLASNWDMELLRLKILELDGPEALAALDASYPSHLPTTSRDAAGGSVSGFDPLAEDLASWELLFGRGGASNAWVVGPTRTASGRPIVANDPHLNNAHPGLWYLAHVRWQGGGVAGASVVGFPAIAPGHNGFAAWGVTAAHADNTDLFLEQIGPDGRSVREGDELVPCSVRQERIAVRGGGVVVEEVLETPRGPLVSPPLEGAPQLGGAYGLSLAATWLSDRPYEGLFGVHRARSFESFRDCFERGSTSTLCAVYGDAEGHYGWALAVELPRRRTGLGHLPLPGWEPATGWEPDLVPFDALPREQGAGDGFYCTANNKPAGADAGPHLGVDWLDGYRQARISEVLATRHDWTPEATAELQLDTQSLVWREVRDTVLAVGGEEGSPERRATALLAAWDGRMDACSPAASVYALFMATLCRRVVAVRAPRATAWALGRGFFTPLLPHSLIVTRRLGHLSRLMREQPEGFFESWPEAIRTALAAACTTLRDRFGDDEARWAWGTVRPLVLRHAFGQKPPLDRVFDIGPLPGAGDASTVAQGAVDFADPLRGQITVASLRCTIDVGDWDRSRFALCGGQSGNPLSPHYDDQIASWQSGEGVEVAWTEPRIVERTEHTLRLVPSGRG